MAPEQSCLDSMVNDLELFITRKEGRWDCKITGIPLPRDIHQAQQLLANVYRGQRRKIADNYHASKQKFEERMREVKEAERKLKVKGQSNGTESEIK